LAKLLSWQILWPSILDSKKNIFLTSDLSHPAKVLLKVFAILFKILSGYCAREGK